MTFRGYGTHDCDHEDNTIKNGKGAIAIEYAIRVKIFQPSLIFFCLFTKEKEKESHTV